jgi:hypothetical protein
MDTKTERILMTKFWLTSENHKKAEITCGKRGAGNMIPSSIFLPFFTNKHHHQRRNKLLEKPPDAQTPNLALLKTGKS